jgi:hypothetical protein
MLPDAIEWQLAVALSRQCPYDGVNRRSARAPARLSHSAREIDFAAASCGLAFVLSKDYSSAKGASLDEIAQSNLSLRSITGLGTPDRD